MHHLIFFLRKSLQESVSILGIKVSQERRIKRSQDRDSNRQQSSNDSKKLYSRFFSSYRVIIFINMIIILGWHRSVTWNEWILQSRVLRAKRRREDSKYAEENRIQDNDREFYNQGTHSLLTSNNLLASSFTVTCHWSQHCACWKQKGTNCPKILCTTDSAPGRVIKPSSSCLLHNTNKTEVPLESSVSLFSFWEEDTPLFLLTIIDRWEGGSSSDLIHGYIVRSARESSVVIRS